MAQSLPEHFFRRVTVLRAAIAAGNGWSTDRTLELALLVRECTKQRKKSELCMVEHYRLIGKCLYLRADHSAPGDLTHFIFNARAREAIDAYFIAGQHPIELVNIADYAIEASLWLAREVFASFEVCPVENELNAAGERIALPYMATFPDLRADCAPLVDLLDDFVERHPLSNLE